MAREYLTGNLDQPFLLPPDMRAWLPPDHLVWFVMDVVDRMDLRTFEARADDPRGRRRYDPAVLVTVLLYAYCVGERSSRRIESRCVEDVAFRLAARDLHPDHTTLARFLKDFAAAFDGLFAQVLQLAARAGMGRVGTIVLDGTKVAADASPLAAKSQEAIAEEVRRITEEARRTDEAEDELYGEARGDELPPELADPRSRRARLDEALRQLEAEAAKDATRWPSRQRRRRPLRANITDPDSRVMKGPRGYFPGFNGQAVASEDGLIVAADVTNDQADNHLFTPMVDQACDNTVAAGMGRPARAVADNGYYSNTNATSDQPSSEDAGHRPERPRPEPFIAPPTDRRRAKLGTRGPIPQGATPAQVMARKLGTQAGGAAYRQRGATIEPIFGMIKSARGINRFRRRGLEAARSEWRLVATTHNVLKLWRQQGATAAAVTL
jgi:transposase